MRIGDKAFEGTSSPPGGLLSRTLRGRRNPLVADVARLRSLRYLFTKRWDERSIAHSLLKLAQHIFNYRLLKRHKVIDCVLCPSKYIQSVLSSTDIETKHLPLPAPSATDKSNRPESPFTFVFAGRVEPEKGLALFLESLPDDLQGKLVIIGEGSELQLCREICEQRQLQIEVNFPWGKAWR